MTPATKALYTLLTAKGLTIQVTEADEEIGTFTLRCPDKTVTNNEVQLCGATHAQLSAAGVSIESEPCEMYFGYGVFAFTLEGSSGFLCFDETGDCMVAAELWNQ